MRLRLIFCLFVATSPLFAQQVRVQLNVPKVTSLRMAAASPEVQVTASTTNRLFLRVRRPASGSAIVRLVARSNTAYQLLVHGPDEGVRLRIVAVKPFAGTEHLMPGAENVHITEPVWTNVMPVTILEGPRISNGGNDMTPTNALMIELEVNSSDANADVAVLMQPMAN